MKSINLYGFIITDEEADEIDNYIDTVDESVSEEFPVEDFDAIMRFVKGKYLANFRGEVFDVNKDGTEDKTDIENIDYMYFIPLTRKRGFWGNDNKWYVDEAQACVEFENKLDIFKDMLPEEPAYYARQSLRHIVGIIDD